MRLITLLNHCYKFKSFVYAKERHEPEKNRVIIEVKPRKNGRPICSGCHQPGTTYDHQPNSRYFDFVPIWGIAVLLCYTMRRVNCKTCGVKIESVPWCEGKHSITKAYQLFLARWARRLSWKEVAEIFNTSWDTVYRSVFSIVSYGLKHRHLKGIQALGVDEIQFGKGHQYLTLIYQVDSGCKRLLSITQERTAKSFLRGLRSIGMDNLSDVRYWCSDMWRAYIKVINKKFPNAIHVLDRFHIVKKLNEAVDDVRREETKQMKADGLEPILKNSRFCFLKNSENLTEKQKVKLDELIACDLKSVKAYLFKEAFQAFWQYTHPAWAKKFLSAWCDEVEASELKPMHKFVGTVKRHQELMMNWFKAKKMYSSGSVEGLNRKFNLVTRKSYGFKSFEVLKIALFHTMGGLPEPKMTHRFC